MATRKKTPSLRNKIIGKPKLVVSPRWLSRRMLAVFFASVVIVGGSIYTIDNSALFNHPAHAAGAGTLTYTNCAKIGHPTFQSCWYYDLRGACGWYNGHILFKLNGYPYAGWKATVADTEQGMEVYADPGCKGGYYEADFQYYTGTHSNPHQNFEYIPMGKAYYGQTVNNSGVLSNYSHTTTDPIGITSISAVLNSSIGGWHQVQHVTIDCPTPACLN